ncbi:MAG TPA: DMT family transporter [Ramlibacter sp.]|nr:DMT family transporter [Ramlibacter sp.]
MTSLSRRQLALLVAITVVWGFNWPVMKMGVTDYPAFSFRALSIWVGLPILAASLWALKMPFRMPRRHWPELAVLSATNMLVWHACIMLAIKTLSSGRTAILGYTMPIFSAVIGALVFSVALSRRGWVGVSAAALGVVFLLWHEATGMAGRPWGVLLALAAAATWALGTQLMRRTRIDVPTLTIAFWMTAITAVAMTALALAFDPGELHLPNGRASFAIAYNAVLIFGFAQGAWFSLARALPPAASTLSVMFIPVLGVFSGALWLGEALHWQDWAAVALMTVAIGSVLWPARKQAFPVAALTPD